MAEARESASASADGPSAPSRQVDSGLSCLLMMAQYHGLRADPAKLRHDYGESFFDATTVLHAARALGFSAKCVKQPVERLHKAPLPCLALDVDGRFFILAKIDATIEPPEFTNRKRSSRTTGA